ncbi:LON peptidase substrate-binding domain-containing protein [Stieleria sp. TO1_6]|uniref:LON peptidase substrate-binding domain-containing protein n=1 Tax=Stieleria tagensis TaxID=2956795 RepID=UPI00209A9CD9|nr:LON peptidase substrate-binding domain-containing protein [Stieleria tagensis]MCO8121962.1 LON peptidase substrate-binding domain-containing protein [Stieleria tagensis]
MGDLDDLTRLPDDFDGRVRLFPLPSMVLFPHAMQPLHVFEPRYCEMLADALQSDQLIAMATLSGDSASKKQPPAIAKTVCVGKIVSHVEQEDQRHNILLVGIKRARVTAEIDAGRCYRIAAIDVLDDLYPPTGAASRSALRAELLEAFGQIIPATESVQKGLSELLAGSMGLGPISDIISHTLPLSVAMKLQLLAQANVDRRARRLIEFMASGAIDLQGSVPTADSDAAAQRMPFPPPFSTN